MQVYVYKAKKSPTEIVTGELEAEDQFAAVNMLDKMGLTPVDVVEKPAENAARKPVRETETSDSMFRRVSAGEIDAFIWQLASLLKANVSILAALSLIADQTKSTYLRDVVNQLAQLVQDGSMLSQAMAKYPRVFDHLTLSVVRVGEQGAVLPEAMFKLAESRDKQRELQRTVQAALAYPLLILIVGAVSVHVMLTVFLPKLTGLFENMQGTLPLPTRMLLAVSNSATQHWHWGVIVVLLMTAIFVHNKPGSKKKFFLDFVKLNTPFVKTFVAQAEIAKFARTLSLLLKSGIPVHVGIELAAETLDNDALKGYLRKAVSGMLDHGETLTGSLKKIDSFPRLALNVVAVGEASGNLEAALDEVGNLYEREVNHAVKIMSSLIEPVLILVVGTVVGFIVFAMLLPIFEIGQTVR